VDIVLEGGGLRVAGVEVKAAGTVTQADFRGLRRLAAAAGKRFTGGVVLYDGEVSASFGDRLQAVPIGAPCGRSEPSGRGERWQCCGSISRTEGGGSE
jgi:hypothetical protein